VREHYTVVPSSASPRLLVPRGDRKVSASAVRQAIVATSGRARVRQRALAAIFTAGLGDLVFRDTVTVDATAPLSAHLSGALGREVRVSMRFGPPRANRKPVLQLLDPSGECLAFVKVGVNDITRDLVRVETDILRGLEGRDLGLVRVPNVLHAGPWHDDAELLVVEALPVWLPATATPAEATEARIAAMKVVAGADGVRVDALPDYLDGLDVRIAKLGDHPLAPMLADAVSVVRATGRALATGGWHGDWNPGNMAVRYDRVLLWDWERYATGVPVGLDELHFEFGRTAASKQRSAADAAADVRSRAADLLAPFGMPAEDARLVWALYATEIATRFVGDRQEDAGSKLGQVGTWLPAALAELRA
jgi:hypothetical protein